MKDRTVLEQEAMEQVQLDKKSKDRAAILQMAGKFKVTFDFAETFSSNSNYIKEENYTNESIEYILVIQDEPDLISLQHILVINDQFVVKHWRQDWLYENQEFLFFDKEGVWEKSCIGPEEAKGTWTQKVFQVDDSPRYQGFGTWVFVDGKSYWEATAAAPLPRRQENRTDYNVLIRNNRISILPTGWLMEQDNQKVYRNAEGKDECIVWEKGIENQLRGDYNVQPAIDYWEKHQQFWADARAVWQEIIDAQRDELRVHEKLDGKNLYDKIFALDRQFSLENYDQRKNKDNIRQIIAAHQF